MAADPYRYFRVEAREIVEQLTQGVLELEKGPQAVDQMARLLRLCHTLKGAARVVRQPAIAEKAHELEGLLAALREPDAGRAGTFDADRALALLKDIRERVGTLDAGQSPEPGAPPPAHLHVFRPDTADLETIGSAVEESQRRLGDMNAHLAEADPIRHLIELIDDRILAQRTREGEGGNVDKTAALIAELRQRFGRLRATLSADAGQVSREVSHIAETAARLRLVPATAMFPVLELAVRDAAQALGRRVRFEGAAADTRLESETLSVLQAALSHAVRNAVVHGIENEPDRLARGKSAEGRIRLTVARRGSSAVLVCEDDGGGIDHARVRRLLESRGQLDPGAAATPDTIIQRLLTGGVSTSATVTQMAGRGIGLAVIRDAAQRLGGRVTIDSEPGTGTRVTITIPVSSMAFEGLVVSAGGATAVIPLDSVERATVMTRDGEDLPVRDLGPVIQPLAPRHQAARQRPVIIIKNRGQRTAFAVDHVVGIAVVVSKSLPPLACSAPCIAGTSRDPEGRTRLVLDPEALLAASGLPAAAETLPVARKAILVVDDSLTTRMLERSILESAGYDVVLASSAEEGLERVRARRVDMALVDVEMPGMDGYEFIERLRADASLRDIPAILVTSRELADDRRRGSEAGAQGFVVKSDFDQRALLEQIRELVR
jgi:two-component system chemotaxis sensor kinase CheA